MARKGTTPSTKAVDDAIAAAIGRSLALQRADGGWEGVNETGPMNNAIALIAHRVVGGFTDDERDALLAWMLAEQLPNGAFPGWPGEPDGDRSTTSLVVAAMHASGLSASDARRRRAEAWLDAHGGYGGLMPFCEPLGVAVGLRDPSVLGFFPHAARLSRRHGDWMARVFGLNTLVPFHSLAGLYAGLALGASRGGRLVHPVLARSADLSVAYFTERQDPGGGWAGVTFITMIVAVMLRLCRVPADDPRITRAMSWCRGHLTPMGAGLHLPTFRSTFWDTAQQVRGLLACGVSADHPAIRRASAFLLPHQTRGESPWDWQTPPKGAPPDAGWPFQPGNQRNPDIDSSGEVLSAMALLQGHPGVADAAGRARDWLAAMQNPDGGWAAFSHGKPGHPSGALHLPPRERPDRSGPFVKGADGLDRIVSLFAELGDPSAAGITGRMLWAMGAMGHRAGEPLVDQSASFLKYHQVAGIGGWWGRWAVNYVPTTAYVVTGLAKCGVDPQTPWVASGLDFLERVQQADGAWGESVASYQDPTLAGKGPPVRSITGFGLWALSAGGRATSDAARRGVSYLLATQQLDGGWLDDAMQGVLMPGVGYYRNATFSVYVPLEALGTWRSSVR
jgi:squalene-hopene/tetraprenyl-beta-curcumene cyclase